MAIVFPNSLLRDFAKLALKFSRLRPKCDHGRISNIFPSKLAQAILTNFFKNEYITL